MAFAQLAARTVVRPENPLGTLPPGGTVGVLHNTRLLKLKRCRSSIPWAAISLACPRLRVTESVRSDVPMIAASPANRMAANERAITSSMSVKPSESGARRRVRAANGAHRATGGRSHSTLIGEYVDSARPEM